MHFDTIIYESTETGVIKIIFNRSETFNAYNEKMCEELKNVIEQISKDPKARVLILSGTGDHFMVGADINMLKNWSKLTEDQIKEVMTSGFSPTMLEELDIPVIAAIKGYAMGMGAEIAWACDLRFITEDVVFGQPEINLGVIPGAGGTQRLPLLVGYDKAFEMQSIGKKLYAQEALSLNIVHKMVSTNDLEEEVMKYVNKLLEKSRFSISQIKKAQAAHKRSLLLKGLNAELDLFVKTVISPDAKEGIEAFLEKRKPNFNAN